MSVNNWVNISNPADEMQEMNPFKKENDRIHKTFTRKYGFFFVWGEKLYTEKDKKKKENGFYTIYALQITLSIVKNIGK